MKFCKQIVSEVVYRIRQSLAGMISKLSLHSKVLSEVEYLQGLEKDLTAITSILLLYRKHYLKFNTNKAQKAFKGDLLIKKLEDFG